MSLLTYEDFKQSVLESVLLKENAKDETLDKMIKDFNKKDGEVTYRGYTWSNAPQNIRDEWQEADVWLKNKNYSKFPNVRPDILGDKLYAAQTDSNKMKLFYSEVDKQLPKFMGTFIKSTFTTICEYSAKLNKFKTDRDAALFISDLLSHPEKISHSEMVKLLNSFNNKT